MPSLDASVVVPTRNRAQMLTSCLETLLRQETPKESFEVIVIDDGSTDGTAEVVSMMKERSSDTQLVYKRLDRSIGLNGVRNMGLRLSKGEITCFVDDDVTVPDRWLNAMIAGASRHRGPVCFGGPIHLVLQGDPLPLCERLCRGRDGGEGYLDLGLRELEAREVFGGNMAVTREAVRVAGMFDESIMSYGDESEWQLRLIREGGKIVYLPDALLFHHRTADDMRLTRVLKRRFRRGLSQIAYRQRIGMTTSPRSEFMAGTRAIGHWGRRRCVGGLLEAATRFGRVWGVAKGIHKTQPIVPRALRES